MLKHIYLNQKKVPVPIPVKNLYEAVLWVEKHLLRDGFSITRICLDNDILDILDEPEKTLRSIVLGGESRLEIQVDSVQDISIQTIDAVRNLCSVLERGLKPLAVNCWQLEEHPDKHVDLTPTFEDLELILDLLSHVEILVQNRVSIANIHLIGENIAGSLKEMQKASQQGEWKLTAKILLKHLEPNLSEMNHELSMLQNTVFESFAEKKESQVKLG